MAAKPTVLLVDDEPQIRFAVRRFLESRDYAIMEADSCSTALEACRKAQPDAILMDYNLPDGNALDLMPQLDRKSVV